MTQRERMMIFAVGGLAVLVGGYFGVNTALTHYQAKQGVVDAKERELAKAKADLEAAKLIEKKVSANIGRSLPGDRIVAGNVYKEWLKDSLLNERFIVESVNAGESFLETKKEYGKLKFDVRSSARLDDLTRWLNKFYSVDCLHRIKSLKLSPLQDSKMLSVTIDIEVITLAKSTKDTSKFRESKKEKGKTEAEMQAQFDAERDRLLASIAGRNVFGPPNHEPTLAPIGKIPATVGKSVEVIAKGKDKKDGTNETDDEALLLYEIVDSDIPKTEFTFDEVKGVLRWTPKKKGDYKATVEVVDDGIPQKRNRQTFTIAVGDPPKAGPPPVEKKPSFDVAKWAFVTAIVEEEGKGQVWINERSTGKSTKLKLGDEVKYGTVNGKVSRIESTGIEVETRDAKFFTKIGKSLGDAATQAGGS